MAATAPRILTLNGGSSSVKLALFEAGRPPRRVLSGGFDRAGQPTAMLREEGRGGVWKNNRSDAALKLAQRLKGGRVQGAQPEAASEPGTATGSLLRWIEQSSALEGLAAIGHRLVHGGPKYYESQLLTPPMLEELRRLSPFDPEHLPRELQMVEAVGRRFPELPQIACFDTAFHHDLPRVARLLAIPRRYETQGVRRYGFHGLSYTFLMGELARVAGPEAARGRVILAHLGSGASLAAVRGGRPVDTSMGFTPASGLPMATRSGDLDPGLVSYLARTEGLDSAGFDALVNGKSGLLGVSETSGDMRELLAREAQDARAADAVELFCYQVRKWIGAYAAALGGLDTLVFAGGIGESAPVVRARICEGLGFLGVELDGARNAAGASVISNGRVAVRVVHTDEELVIATDICRVLGLG
jgi:acetate kinase